MFLTTACRARTAARGAMRAACLLLAAALTLSFDCVAAERALPVLTLDQAVRLALAQDPWQQGSRHTERALREEALAAAALPDPSISLRAGNFPVDTLDVNQEPMTQSSIALSQRFPRGQSRALARRQKEQLASGEPLLRAERRAQLEEAVTGLWLDAWEAAQTIALIESERGLLEQAAELATARYATTVDGARQTVLLDAQLALLRLADRVTRLQQQRDAAQQRLVQWLGQPVSPALNSPVLPALRRSLPPPASAVGVEAPGDAGIDDSGGDPRFQWIRQHPALRALEQRIEASRTGVDLAREQYKPEWGLSAQYGFRARDLAGEERADLLSVGLNFELPLFGAARQDRLLGAARSRHEALRTERLLLARRLLAGLDAAGAELSQLARREALYGDQLLPQLERRAAATLAAYQRDDGGFGEVLDARIAELDARIEHLRIRAQRGRTVARINYLLAQAPVVDETTARYDTGDMP